MPCEPLSALGGPSGTGCDGLCFLVYSSWNSRDVTTYLNPSQLVPLGPPSIDSGAHGTKNLLLNIQTSNIIY